MVLPFFSCCLYQAPQQSTLSMLEVYLPFQKKHRNAPSIDIYPLMTSLTLRPAPGPINTQTRMRIIIGTGPQNSREKHMSHDS